MRRGHEELGPGGQAPILLPCIKHPWARVSPAAYEAVKGSLMKWDQEGGGQACCSVSSTHEHTSLPCFFDPLAPTTLTTGLAGRAADPTKAGLQTCGY